jgi:NAD+ diphosphatase
MILVTHEGRLLLARKPAFPAGRFSALAGFVEPGETLEDTVIRETREEVGVEVRNIRYFGSQPWPFPHSLMIGAIAEVENDDEKIDAHELESARWFAREEARALIAGKHADAFCPPPFAIAHQILKSWAE